MDRVQESGMETELKKENGRPRKLRILCFTTCYLPGYKFGGPIRTIENMVNHLADDFEWYIVTSDRDVEDTGPYPDAKIGAWNTVGNSQVLYLGPEQRGLKDIAKVLRETPYDILYLNSFFDPVFTIRPLLARRLGMAPSKPCVLATRGEFSEGAFKLKFLKKKIFTLVVPFTGLYAGITWQASSQFEAEDMRRVLGSHPKKIEEALDLPPPQSALVDKPGPVRQAGAPLQVCFLSRVHPKKNLSYALEALKDVKIPVQYNIYGPIFDEAYWKKCQDLILALPSNVKATYCGSVTPAEVPDIMAKHDLFYFPTLGENYGHVIAEALSAGTPVLLADTTPWRGMEEAGVGWDLPLDDPHGFATRIESLYALDVEAWPALRRRIRAYAVDRLTDASAIEANKRLFWSTQE